VPLAGLPSRHEAFFILPDVPDGVYSNAKVGLGCAPLHRLHLQPIASPHEPLIPCSNARRTR
jgi:hypothetical protein